MNEKLTFSGGEPNINFDDIDRNNKANKAALIAAFRAYGDNYIIQGVTGDPSITAGYVMLDGEILQVDAHTKTGTHFVKVTTYDSAGDKTFNNGIARQTWAKNRATITAGSGSLAYSGAKRMPDVLVDTITAGTSILAPANLPDATTSAKGVQENATSAESNALTATDKTVTPGTIPIASETQKGLIEVATAAEIDAGTSGVLAVIASELKRKLDEITTTTTLSFTGTSDSGITAVQLSGSKRNNIQSVTGRVTVTGATTPPLGTKLFVKQITSYASPGYDIYFAMAASINTNENGYGVIETDGKIYMYFFNQGTWNFGTPPIIGT